MGINYTIVRVIAPMLIFFGLLAPTQKPFWDEIKAFKQQDSISAPPSNSILFVGSSSFRFWSNVQEYFPSYPIINRGFGGSSLPDLIGYADDIIFPYNPKQIVVYCGENDLAASTEITSKMVADRFVKLFTLIRNRNNKVNIVYVSIKPSPSRKYLLPKMKVANSMIETFLKNERNAFFVDVYSKMLDQNGKPIKNLFGRDSLHMNKNGYEIWKKVIQPYLVN